jgi:hypothetical protein
MIVSLMYALRLFHAVKTLGEYKIFYKLPGGFNLLQCDFYLHWLMTHQLTHQISTPSLCNNYTDNTGSICVIMRRIVSPRRATYLRLDKR